MQLVQKAKITIINFQDIILDDNTIHLSIYWIKKSNNFK